MRTDSIANTFFFKKIARIDRMLRDAEQVNNKRKDLIEHIIATEMGHYLKVVVGANKNSVKFGKALTNSAVRITRITRKMRKTAELIDNLKKNCKSAFILLHESSINYEKQMGF